LQRTRKDRPRGPAPCGGSLSRSESDATVPGSSAVKKRVKDVAASVRQKLLSNAKSSNRPFQEVLQYFAMERFLYRLAQSPTAPVFPFLKPIVFPMAITSGRRLTGIRPEAQPRPRMDRGHGF